MTRTKVLSVFAAALMAGAAIAGTANAEAYKPGDKIKILQGFKPGGGSDALAQLVLPFLTKEMNVTFVNEYIPGAAGAIAWAKLGNATKNDGYTISITNSPMIVSNYLLNDEIKYNVKQLEPIANVVTDPGILVVGPNSPYKTFQDFLAAAKAAPDKITIGNSGVGGDDFFSTIFLGQLTGAKFKMVPFSGDGPSATAAMGDKIDASANNLGIVYAQLKASNLRALAIFSEKRHPKLPDVPTMKELGYNLVNGSSRGFSAPAGIPKEKRDALVNAFKKVLSDPAFLAEAERQTQDIEAIIGDDYKKLIYSMEDVYRPIVEEVKKNEKK
ncbi:Bug family tripartite tricarboxylate transporter substrate binding protein [Shumkonia mesophila]|uniref:Bug family tripartite tricarboxylate transporter substrate binding protein n=1 Tax=Shumkonia mesophila TaxID=2838854 RepID=UPI002934BC37|nr:tripartite tricarboxylate transporter substrate binding protein [Shumkonia mesophila]